MRVLSLISKQEREILELDAWRSLADTHRLASVRINSDLRRYGLTLPQYSVLRAVGRSEAGYLAMNQIGQDLLVTYADVTLIVDNLEKHNWLRRRREARDRRVVRIELTQEGRQLWKRISSVHKKRIAKLLRGLSKQELIELKQVTSKIREEIISSNNQQ